MSELEKKISQNFINVCLQGIYLNKKMYYSSFNPKITAAIIFYNSQDFIHYSLKSIQNQNMKNIEILLLDDGSTDNTSKIIKNITKEDKRIKLLKNDCNRKQLYSRAKAVQNAKGKYIIWLDSDDLFMRSDLFTILSEEAEQENYDIINFRYVSSGGFSLKNRVHYSKKYNNRFDNPIKQPILSNLLVSTEQGIHELLIKLNIYKETVNRFDPFILNRRMNFREDSLMLETIIQNSNTFKYSDILGYMIILRKNSSTKEKHVFIEFDNFFYINYLYDMIKTKNMSLNSLVNFILKSINPNQSEEVLDFGTIVLNKIIKDDKL